jgi:hypothetical protein
MQSIRRMICVAFFLFALSHITPLMVPTLDWYGCAAEQDLSKTCCSRIAAQRNVSRSVLCARPVRIGR